MKAVEIQKAKIWSENVSFLLWDCRSDGHNQTENLVDISWICRCDRFFEKQSAVHKKRREGRESPRESPYNVTRATQTVKSSKQKNRLMKCMDLFPNAFRPMSAYVRTAGSAMINRARILALGPAISQNPSIRNH